MDLVGMNGVVDWNELWKLTIMSSPMAAMHSGEGNRGAAFAKQCNLYLMGKKGKERTEMEISKMKLRPEYSVLDIGSGQGRLAIPISRQVKSVTAIDPSKVMMEFLRENMAKEGAKNITCINKRWEDIRPGIDIEPHDVVIASHSLGMFDMQEALKKIDVSAKRYVYLFVNVGGRRDDVLSDVIYGERRPSQQLDYIYLCNILHDLDIFANVEIFNSELELQFDSLDDAMNEWRLVYGIAPERGSALRAYAERTLVKDDNDTSLYLRRKQKIAMIWWKRESGVTN
jgi:FkbM family methyltransferase